MKVPDKIYAGYRFKNNHEDLYARKTQLTYRDTEYIRKDALLEWAKEEKSKCSDESHPYAQFMNVVIDKLNSL